MKKDKPRDVARSVLPSRASRAAREDKRDFHHIHRHAQRQILHEIVRSTTVVDEDDGYLYTDIDLFDDFEPAVIVDGYHARTKKDGAGYDMDIGYIVQQRRDADNLGPLLSWARGTERQKMDGWSVEDKHAYFKAVLPDTLQGRHALGHVETALNLELDEFRWGRYHRRYTPVNKEQFRAALANILSTSKGRAALREFILETVPVAAHITETNNKVRSRIAARDESGEIRYLPAIRTDPVTKRLMTYSTRPPMMVDVYVPQIVVATCDDCSFLRNDPLATAEAVVRFTDTVWASRQTLSRYGAWNRRPEPNNGHSSFYEVRQYIIDSRVDHD